MTDPTGERLQLDALIQHALMGIAVIDYRGVYEVVNPTYCDIYGYPEDELLGRNFSLVFPPAQFSAVLACHQRFLDEGGELSSECEVIRRDGEQLSTLSDSVRVPDAEGHKRRLVYVLDITQHMQMEREVRQSEALLLDLATSLPAMPTLSPGIEALFGITRQHACVDSRSLRRCEPPSRAVTAGSIGSKSVHPKGN